MFENWASLLQRTEIQFPRDVLESVVRGKRVLITGAGGSIGASLARLVARHDPEQLVLLDSHEASMFYLRQQMLDDGASSNVRYVLADLRDRSKIDQVFRRSRTDVVFHLAAYKHIPFAEDNVDQVFGVNVLGTLNVFEAAREHGTSTIAYPSSDKAVTPLGVYAASKRLVERVFQSLAFESDRPALRIVRLVNVFETQGNVIQTFIRQIRANQPLTITDPRMDRYWMTKQEATHLLVAAATRVAFEGFYMLDVGEPVLISDTARRVHELLHPDGGHPVIRVSGIRPGERLHEELKFPSERFRPTELPGLLVIESPPPTIDAKSWLDELMRLRDSVYELEASDVKARLIDLASRAEFATAGFRPRPAANV
jgi:FlaA1/EpsC-like NDP-sugar epimerase